MSTIEELGSFQAREKTAAGPCEGGRRRYEPGRVAATSGAVRPEGLIGPIMATAMTSMGPERHRPIGSTGEEQEDGLDRDGEDSFPASDPPSHWPGVSEPGERE